MTTYRFKWAWAGGAVDCHLHLQAEPRPPAPPLFIPPPTPAAGVAPPYSSLLPCLPAAPLPIPPPSPTDCAACFPAHLSSPRAVDCHLHLQAEPRLPAPPLFIPPPTPAAGVAPPYSSLLPCLPAAPLPIPPPTPYPAPPPSPNRLCCLLPGPPFLPVKIACRAASPSAMDAGAAPRPPPPACVLESTTTARGVAQSPALPDVKSDGCWGVRRPPCMPGFFPCASLILPRAATDCLNRSRVFLERIVFPKQRCELLRAPVWIHARAGLAPLTWTGSRK